MTKQQPMHIVVLMAGDGQRFVNAGYVSTPKPLIAVDGKIILEHTTASLPFIMHYNQAKIKNIKYEMTFAIRKHHNIQGVLAQKLERIYGPYLRFKEFNSLTEGNLVTAILTTLCYSEFLECPLLVLDADNKYDGKNFLPTLKNIKDKEYAAICYFKPKNDESEKWCFAEIEPKSHRVLRLSEKKKIKNGYPMMGVFYFSEQKLFNNLAREVVCEKKKTINKEFYMSQTIQLMIEKNIPVYGFEAPKVWPLGTPEDFEAFKKNNKGI